jgi:hypothetical protein
VQPVTSCEFTAVADRAGITADTTTVLLPLPGATASVGALTSVGLAVAAHWLTSRHSEHSIQMTGRGPRSDRAPDPVSRPRRNPNPAHGRGRARMRTQGLLGHSHDAIALRRPPAATSAHAVAHRTAGPGRSCVPLPRDDSSQSVETPKQAWPRTTRATPRVDASRQREDDRGFKSGGARVRSRVRSALRRGSPWRSTSVGSRVRAVDRLGR